MKQTALMRILMLMLALCMMVSVFAACATEDDGEGATCGQRQGAAGRKVTAPSAGGGSGDDVGIDAADGIE